MNFYCTEYRGETLSGVSLQERQKQYDKARGARSKDGSFMLYYRHDGTKFGVDAINDQGACTLNVES